jgi:hypothetical protein
MCSSSNFPHCRRIDHREPIPAATVFAFQLAPDIEQRAIPAERLSEQVGIKALAVATPETKTPDLSAGTRCVVKGWQALRFR